MDPLEANVYTVCLTFLAAMISRFLLERAMRPHGQVLAPLDVCDVFRSRPTAGLRKGFHMLENEHAVFHTAWVCHACAWTLLLEMPVAQGCRPDVAASLRAQEVCSNGVCDVMILLACMVHGLAEPRLLGISHADLMCNNSVSSGLQLAQRCSRTSSCRGEGRHHLDQHPSFSGRTGRLSHPRNHLALVTLVHPHQRCGYSDSPFAREDNFLYCRVWKWVGGGGGAVVVLGNGSKNFLEIIKKGFATFQTRQER